MAGTTLTFLLDDARNGVPEYSSSFESGHEEAAGLEISWNKFSARERYILQHIALLNPLEQILSLKVILSPLR